MATTTTSVSHPPSKQVLVSAPGKVILFGEHAVVYGKAAIATSVDLRCYILLTPTSTGTVSLKLPAMQLDRSWHVRDIAMLLTSAEDKCIEAIKGYCNASIEPTMLDMACIILLYLMLQVVGEGLHSMSGLDVFISSDLPFGAGLGSSAAYSVSIATGLMASCGLIQIDNFNDFEVDSQLCEQLPSIMSDRVQSLGLTGHVCPLLTDSVLTKVNQFGLEAEKIIHGAPSGIDNSISTYGGAIFFKSGKFSPLSMMPNLNILLVYTKVSRSTKKMVSAVRQRYESYPNVICPIMESMDSIAIRGKSLLEQLSNDSSDQETLQDLLAINHHLLNALGVGHTSLEEVFRIGNENGLVSKMTGAGGGGCAIILIESGFVEDRLFKAIEDLKSAGFDCWQTSIGSKGVTIHCST